MAKVGRFKTLTNVSFCQLVNMRERLKIASNKTLSNVRFERKSRHNANAHSPAALNLRQIRVINFGHDILEIKLVRVEQMGRANMAKCAQHAGFRAGAGLLPRT